MKTISTALAQHLLQPLTSMVKCCRIQWQNGTVLGFTAFDQPLVIEGQTYTPVPGVQDFAVQTQGDTSVDTTELLGVIDEVTIKTSDLEDGLWDFADVRFFEVNWQDLSQGVLNLRSGKIGEVKLARGAYQAEIRGLSQALTRELGDLLSTECQADLGDARCKVNLSGFTVTGTVTNVIDGRTFTDSALTQAEHWFDGGQLQWTSGSNNGKRMEIEYFSPTKTVVLFLQLRHPIQVGDTYSMYAGCSKSSSDCINKFNNIANNRSYFTAPNADQLLQYPNSHV